jgi:hypothetical protein
MEPVVVLAVIVIGALVLRALGEVFLNLPRG